MLYQICHGAVSFADEEILHDINLKSEIRKKLQSSGGTAAAKPRS